MKILYVIPNTSTGGVENLVTQYGLYFKGKGCDVDVLSFSEGNNNVFKQFNNIYIVRNSSKSIISSYLRLKRFFKTHNHYDVVHTNVHYYNGIIAKLSHKYGIGVIVSHVHSNGGDCSNIVSTIYNKTINSILRVFILKHSTKLLACSYKSGDLMYGKDSHFEFFPNCIDTDKYKYDVVVRKSIREQLGIYDSTVVMMHVGRFSEEKNHKFLLKVFSCYHKRNANSVLLLLGEGPLKKETEEYSNYLQLGNSVRFLGYQSNVYQYFNVADIFILPSFFEGFPVSLVEAQASGVLSYASDTIPQEVIITDRAFRLSLSLSEEQWAAEVPDTCNNNEREKYSTIVHCAKFDIEDALKRLEFIYSVKQ